MEIKIKTINWCLSLIDDEKLLEKYKAIWNQIELNALPVYDDKYIKTKIKRYGAKGYTNSHTSLNVLEDDIERKSFSVISIDSLLVYERKYYLEVYLDNCAYKIANKQMTKMTIFFGD